ncbi:MAG: DUF692 domain-containing protein [Myxococcales bacterium FL481]|nr:MAG: DUF692 domain-containing protein [Myxococcales bacterium FL481]
MAEFPSLGLGVALREPHFEQILTQWPAIDWFEATPENHLGPATVARAVLRRVAERYPVALHSVSIGISGLAEPRRTYLQALKQLADEVKAVWISDHLGPRDRLAADETRVAFLDEDLLARTCARVRRVQDALERPLVLENPSSVAGSQQATMSEPEFLRCLCEETDCGLLLDVANVYASCLNGGVDPRLYLDAVPWERVVQLHVGGLEWSGRQVVDTHEGPVDVAVWELFRTAWRRSGGASTSLEWDGAVPALPRLHAEVLRARAYMPGGSASDEGLVERRRGEGDLVAAQAHLATKSVL